MMMTLIVPELVVIWALRQWLTVRRLWRTLHDLWLEQASAAKGTSCFYDPRSTAKFLFRSSTFENYGVFCPYGRFYR
jgi:hypothetical protein